MKPLKVKTRVSPGNLTLADIHPSLRHEAHPSLGFLATESAEVVHIWGLVCDLEITNATVTLRERER